VYAHGGGCIKFVEEVPCAEDSANAVVHDIFYVGWTFFLLCAIKGLAQVMPLGSCEPCIDCAMYRLCHYYTFAQPIHVSIVPSTQLVPCIDCAIIKPLVQVFYCALPFVFAVHCVWGRLFVSMGEL
jgi:hypothetical protein